MNKVTNVVDTALLCAGIVYSLENIQHILGIVMLCVQLAWILGKLCYKLITTIRAKGNLTDLDKDVADVVDKIGEIKDSLPQNREVTDNEHEE